MSIEIDGEAFAIEQGYAGQTLPDLSEWYWRDSANHNYTDGMDSIIGFDLKDGETLWIDCIQGSPNSVRISTEGILSLLQDWYSNQAYDDIEYAEFLAGWGIDPLEALALALADESWDGPCRIWCVPCYYPGTFNAPLPAFYRKHDEDGRTSEIVEFETYADAKAAYDEYYNAPSAYDGIPACNVLSHGQAGSDTLVIVRSQDSISTVSTVSIDFELGPHETLSGRAETYEVEGATEDDARQQVIDIAMASLKHAKLDGVTHWAWGLEAEGIPNDLED